MLRVGIVGAGGISRSHLAGLRSVAEVEVAAIHDVDRSAAMSLAASCDADVAGSVADLIAACDAVFVCTWTAAHREIVEAAAAAGRAVFCEKPLAPTLAGAQAMAAAVSSAGVVNQVGLPLRWQAGFAVLRDMVADPANGNVLSVTLHTQMAVRKSVVTGWRRDFARAGGGVLIEVGFHDLDLLEWLFGPVSMLSMSTRPGRYQGIEDAASVGMGFANGAVGSLVAAWHEAPSAHPSRRLHVVCEHAQYLVDGGSQLTVSGPGERAQVLDAS
ncbi:MAG TPA: Gfo/Idh/MocA family oxidoreductase, partial [Mycobacteriales bacterium]|nr:Gfo/Idh/MocA family oxidoreductase [Mycobacteriales bacterium]